MPKIIFSTVGCALGFGTFLGGLGPRIRPPAEYFQGEEMKFKVVCPFDFGQSASASASASASSRPPVTSNPSLWSLALIGVSLAPLAPTYPAAATLALGGTGVALIGGCHKDYRLRRGDFPPEEMSSEGNDALSNLPFVNLVAFVGKGGGRWGLMKMLGLQVLVGDSRWPVG